MDRSGDLYISDIDNFRIRKVTPNGIITTVAGNGSWGYTGDGGSATEAALGYIRALTVDASDNLYLADYSFSVVRKVTPSGIITTIAGVGAFGYSGDGGLATRAALAMPEGLAADKTGNLYVSDSGNFRIRKINTVASSRPLPAMGRALTIWEKAARLPALMYVGPQVWRWMAWAICLLQQATKR